VGEKLTPFRSPFNWSIPGQRCSENSFSAEGVLYVIQITFDSSIQVSVMQRSPLPLSLTAGFVEQIQPDLPEVKPRVTRFLTESGYCPNCRDRQPGPGVA